MFNKLKQKKAPLSLSSVSNAIKNAGNQSLSPDSINPKQTLVNIVSEIGLPQNSVVAMAFDPVQSLLAFSTTKNEVRVYGQNKVEVVFEFQSTSPISILKFVKGVYLVAISPTSGGIMVLSLHSKTLLGTFSPPGAISSVETDPSMDWLILGMTNGSLLFYDVDRLNLTPLRIDNLQKKTMPKERLSPVVGIEWNPRDIGSLLITYSHCAVLYSLVTGEIKNTFVYQLTKGQVGFEYSSSIANGNKKKFFGTPKEVFPELKEAHFHPNGLHVVTVHQDNTFVFWDANDGTLLQARTIFATNLHKKGSPIPSPTTLAPISSVRWICGYDPEYTQLVFVGGDESNPGVLQVLDFGITLKYSLTAHEKQGEFYANPQVGQRAIPIDLHNSNSSEGPEFINQVLPLPADSQPYFGGCQNPSHLIFLSNFGSIYIIRHSTTENISNPCDLGNIILPPSISLIHPPVLFSIAQSIPRLHWYGILSHRPTNGMNGRNMLLLQGGSPTVVHLPRPLGHDDAYRNILITGHDDGLVRLMDISRHDRLEPENVLQVSLRGALYNSGNPLDLKVLHVSCAFESKEMIVGLGNGDIIVCKYGKRNVGTTSTKNYSNCHVQHSNGNASLLDISNRSSCVNPKESTFQPVSVLSLDSPESISCVKMSDIGFAAIGFKSGRLIVCDITRGPAVIFNCESIKQYIPSVTSACYATSFEFSIMEYGKEGFSSILLFVGTCGGGNLLSFKIIPEANGGFQVIFADKTIGLNYKALNNANPENSKLEKIITINSSNGEIASASLSMFQKLSRGIVIPGLVITTSSRDIRVLQTPKTKLSHKVIDDICLTCGVVNISGQGVVLAALVKSGYIKLMALPSLSDIADVKPSKEIYAKLQNSLNSKAAENSMILSTGDIILMDSLTQFFNISVYSKETNKSSKDEDVTDSLFNMNALIPHRPVTSALQWARGQTKNVSVQDLTFLIAGPNRKNTKNQESQLAYNISPEANPLQNYGGYGSSSNNLSKGPSDQVYKEPVRKAAGASSQNFGTRGFMRSLQSGLESVEGTFNGYANDMSEAMTETYSSQKQSLYNSALKSKFGF